MRLATSLIFTIAALTLTGRAVEAKPTVNRLHGQWFGDLVIKVPTKDDQKMPALFGFAKDGTMRSKVGPTEREGHFQIKGNTIVLLNEKKEEEATLVGVKLEKDVLAGELKPSKAMVGDVRIFLDLKRRVSMPPDHAKPKPPH